MTTNQFPEEMPSQRVGALPYVTGPGRDAYSFKSMDAARTILRDVFADYDGAVALTLSNGEVVFGSSAAPCTVEFRRLYPLRELILYRDLVRLGEAHLAGDIEIHGDIAGIFPLLDYLDEKHLALPHRVSLFGAVLRLPTGIAESAHRLRAGSDERSNGRRSIAYHYDVSNEFYQLWLDPEMVYSCAYFDSPSQSLAAAQRDKLDYICRKLRLAPGQRLLDIGCGWGALVRWAALHYGVEAHGITLSQQQYEYACARNQAAGLDDGRVTIELRDYRELPSSASYDRIVSVGMFEHIGVGNFPGYFGVVQRALRPGGLFLNHGITSETGWKRCFSSRFVNRYVFPDGELARVSEVCTAMEEAGFELLDIEALRPHYTLTLRRWVAALEARREAAVALVGEPTYRLWRLYMAGATHYFDLGSIGIHQILAARTRQQWAMPLRRGDLYSR